MLAASISGTANIGSPTALLVMQVAHVTTAVNEVIWVTLLHYLIHFENHFGQLSTQWYDCLFTSYEEVFYEYIGIIDFPPDFTDQVNIVLSIYPDAINTMLRYNSSITIIGLHTQSDEVTNFIQVLQTLYPPPLISHLPGSGPDLLASVYPHLVRHFG